MTTKAPASILESSSESLEKFAYGLVADIPTQEPNDRNRLGYCLWAWLTEHRGSLEQVVHASGVRSAMSNEEIVGIIRKRLEEKNTKGS
ncbi:MAG TPA: hypothetical protein VMU30_11750 [Bacteroidota bacterium]|nr:hypothetical protein [Bacteroidota bacterium]